MFTDMAGEILSRPQVEDLSASRAKQSTSTGFAQGSRATDSRDHFLTEQFDQMPLPVLQAAEGGYSRRGKSRATHSRQRRPRHASLSWVIHGVN
jgi:hypothetical protein